MQDVAAYRAESQSCNDDGSSGEEYTKRVRAKALAAIDALMLTDAPLLYPPGQLALAALRSALKSVSFP